MTHSAPPRQLQSGGAALGASAIVKRYRNGRTLALDDVSLVVPASRITALVGPNGAGKSTLIRIWLGYERPTTGRAEVAGFDPVHDGNRALEYIGYVPQGGSLFRDLSVADHLNLAASFRAKFNRAAAEARLTELRIISSRRIRELSGGQQAQVALAIALATNAPILILDEPLASLDPLARRQFMRTLLDSVRHDGRTVLLSSHVVADIEAVADRIVILVDGHVRLDLDVQEAVASHAVRGDGTGEFVGFIPGVRGPDRAVVRATPRGATEEAALEDVVMAYLGAAVPPGDRR